MWPPIPSHDRDPWGCRYMTNLASGGVSLQSEARVFFPGARSLGGSGMLRRLFKKALSNGGVDYDPYDRTVREGLARREFAAYRDEPVPGTITRSRLILDIIQETFPTEELTKAYFENLDALLRYRQPLRTPGRIAIGIGSGRSGSTRPAAMLATIGGGCCTHRNPPPVSPETGTQ